MQNQMTLSKNNCFFPSTFEQAERYSEKIANSALCPTSFRGKPGDVLIAMQMGAELGLQPLQSLQSIAVINGRPSLYGDGLIAVVLASEACESVREWIENDTAYCAVTRKGGDEQIRTFSVEDAKKAQLWNKPGPWTQYPKRMLQMRARGFALRDVFADVLKGFDIAEDVENTNYEKKERYEPLNSLEKEINKKSEIIDMKLCEENVEVKSLKDRIEIALCYFESKGFERDKIIRSYGLNSQDEMEERHLESLSNTRSAIKEGIMTEASAFQTGEIIDEEVESLNKKMNS